MRSSVRQFMRQRYFNNETREPIDNGLFLEYLELDFLPPIHTESRNQSSNGWLKDERLKILGIARLRQQRVKTDVCKSNGLVTTNNCLPVLDDKTEDKTNYDPSWKSQSSIHSKDKYWRILQPWIYQNSFESQTIAQFGKTKLYAGGGYVCNFGRTMVNSLVVHKFLRTHNWIDARTRVVFIEFTTYGVDSNLFNVITLIAERTQVGYFELSYNIQSVQLLTIIENLPAATIFIFMSYVAIVIAFIWRIVLNLLQSNRRQYFTEMWNIVDLIIVAQSVGVFTIFFVRNEYVRSLLRLLDETRNNEFVSFVYAGLLDQFLL
ncbi:hypothetical protein HA402_012288 [Bradysia odoriphaga]|nr:hypothetical protein HA402_012288 [Bradysia odoriphaga]